MWVPKSVAGLVLCALYLLYAGAVVVADLRRKPSPLILFDATMFIAFPGFVLVMGFAGLLGVSELPRNVFKRLLFYVPAVLVTAALLYLACASIETLLVAAFGHSGRGTR
jgi:hypothetical protein